MFMFDVFSLFYRQWFNLFNIRFMFNLSYVDWPSLGDCCDFNATGKGIKIRPIIE